MSLRNISKKESQTIETLRLIDLSRNRKVLLNMRLNFGLGIENIPTLSCVADTQGNFIFVNRKWAQLGWTKEELLTKPFIEFVHPDDVRKTQVAYEDQVLNDHELIEFNNRFLCKNGEYKELYWYSSRPDHNGMIYAIATFSH